MLGGAPGGSKRKILLIDLWGVALTSFHRGASVAKKM